LAPLIPKDALACYESLGRNSSDVDCGIVNCYLQIDQPHTASVLVKGLMEKVCAIPGPNPTIVSYNALSSLVRFENKKDFLPLSKNALAYYNAGVAFKIQML
jgi:hypothetical protein